MRWATYIVLAALFLTMQSTVAPRLEVGGARPDWLLVCVVFLGLYARPRDAIVGAWIVGLCADLLTVERPGFISLSYMLAALGVWQVREYLFRYWALTQFALTLISALGVQTIWLLYRRATYGPLVPLAWDVVTSVGIASLYTAAWAPILHHLLLRLSAPLGLERPRYSHAGLRATRLADV